MSKFSSFFSPPLYRLLLGALFDKMIPYYLWPIFGEQTMHNNQMEN